MEVEQNTNQTVQVEQTEQTSVSTEEHVVEHQQPTVEDTKEEKVSYFKSFKSEDDWKQYEQSLQNKFSTDILKDFGVSSVKELNDLVKSYKSQNETLNKELSDIRQEKALINVANEYKEDALAIALSKCSHDEKLSLDDAVAQVLDRNPNWLAGVKPSKLGTERTTGNHEGTQSKVLEAFLQRNPNIKKQLEN